MQDALETTEHEPELYGDTAILSFLKREQSAFLACQRTSLAIRLVVLAIFFVPVGVMNPIDASWLYGWLAFYICLEVIAVLSERAAAKKVQISRMRQQFQRVRCSSPYRNRPTSQPPT